jgi:hypothetical protein
LQAREEVTWIRTNGFECKRSVHADIYNQLAGETNLMQRKIFWITFTVIGLLAEMALPFWWSLAATVPIGMLSWWIAYRSDWF